MNALRGRGTCSGSLRRRWWTVADSKRGEEGFENEFDEGPAYKLRESEERKIGAFGIERLARTYLDPPPLAPVQPSS